MINQSMNEMADKLIGEWFRVYKMDLSPITLISGTAEVNGHTILPLYKVRVIYPDDTAASRAIVPIGAVEMGAPQEKKTICTYILCNVGRRYFAAIDIRKLDKISTIILFGKVPHPIAGYPVFGILNVENGNYVTVGFHSEHTVESEDNIWMYSAFAAMADKLRKLNDSYYDCPVKETADSLCRTIRKCGRIYDYSNAVAPGIKLENIEIEKTDEKEEAAVK
jgi:hypothetical protein